jgi:hypothetical protein
LELAEEEKEGQGSKPLHENVSASLLIWQGLELEEQQYVLFHFSSYIWSYLVYRRHQLRADMSSLGQHAMDSQHAALLERGNRICRKIDAWGKIQHLYMPYVASLRAKVDRESGGKPQDATTLDLFLPSQILGEVDCNLQLFKFAWRLHFAQAHDALSDIHRLLILRSRLHHSKERFVHGQYHNTRGMAVLNHVNNRIQLHAKKYWHMCILLQRLATELRRLGSSAQTITR